MIQARIREIKFLLFSKWFWYHFLQRWISARIRHCGCCSKFYISFYDWETCRLCDAESYAEYTKLYEKELNNMPYDEYLQTSHWHYERLGALNRAKHRCQLCNSTKHLDVHHRTYKNRGHEKPEDLTVLCRKCHEHFHIGERNG